MLKIKKSRSFSLPRLSLGGSRPMQLSAVPVDEDELTQAVVGDTKDHDNNWELTDRPDTDELEAYWGAVEQDVRKDPLWIAIDD